jgi:hypothetical protein
MMQPTKHTVPRIAIQSISGGLLLMAFFTMVWAGIASGGLTGFGQYAVLFVFGVPSGMFVAYSISLFRASRHFPPLVSSADKIEGKRMGIWYGIIFGAEGVTIPIVCGLLVYFRQPAFVLPAIALVIGLHFYPMARIFKRTIDYYLATWTCLVAFSAIAAIINNILPPNTIYALLGVGVAIATTGYGLYMIYEGKRLVGNGD